MNKDFINFIIFLLLLPLACEDKKEEPQKPSYFDLNIPQGFAPLIIPDDNKMNKEAVELGRMLFYDPLLEKDGSKSCATCHIQKKAFSATEGPGHMTLGIMPHINLAWDVVYLWHGKVQGSLEDIMLFEVKDFFQTDLQKINAHPTYPSLFKKAYGIDKIEHKHLAYALAQFERTMISADSKFDKFLQKKVELTEKEHRGYMLFFSETADCFHCHGTILFKDNLMHNNGLNKEFQGDNQGHYLISGNMDDMGKFKTPTLRNIALTAPYMHDNRYATLKEVLDFYSDHVNFTPYTDPLMNHEGGIHMTEEEKDDLLHFLNTLTDSAFINNKELGNPFY